MGTIRLVATQGPFQLAVALAVLFHEKDINPGIEYHDFLVLHGVSVGDATEQVNAAMLDMARIWPWKRVICLDEYEQMLKNNRFANLDQKIVALRTCIGVQNVDVLLAIRNWQTTNDLLLRAYSSARKITYSDGIGQIDSLSSPQYVQFDEGRFMLPFRCFSYTRESVIDLATLPYKIVPREYFLKVIELYLQTSERARQFNDYLGKNAGNSIIIVLKNGTESAVTQLEKEVAIYINAALRVADQQTRIMLKPHPRETLHQSQIVRELLRRVYKLDSEIIGQDSYLGCVPLEVFCYRNSFKAVITPLVTAAPRHFKFFFGMQLNDDLNEDVLRVLNPARKFHHLATQHINNAIAKNLPTWDGKSAIYDWSGNSPEEIAIQTEASKKSDFWPQFMAMNNPIIVSLINEMNNFARHKEVGEVSKILHKLVKLNPAELNFLMDLGKIAESLQAYEAAHRIYELATIYDPHKAAPHAALARMCRQLGQNIQAEVAQTCCSWLELSSNK